MSATDWRGGGLVVVVVVVVTHTLALSTDYGGRCYDAERCSLKTTGETWTVDSTCEQATCVQASNGTLLEKRIRWEAYIPFAFCALWRKSGKKWMKRRKQEVAFSVSNDKMHLSLTKVCLSIYYYYCNSELCVDELYRRSTSVSEMERESFPDF